MDRTYKMQNFGGSNGVNKLPFLNSVSPNPHTFSCVYFLFQ